MVGERTAEESSPPGVVEEPGVSRGLHLRLANTFRGLRLLFWDSFVLLGEVRLLLGKNGLFGRSGKKTRSQYLAHMLRTCEFHGKAKKTSSC